MHKFIDTHVHLDFDLELPLDEIINEAHEAGVEKMIVPGVTLESLPKIIEIIDKYENIYGAVAVHPSEAKDWNDRTYDELKDYAKHEKIVAIGETGLDYYWDKSFVDTQKHVFREHLRLAEEMNLPAIVHNRDAHADTLEILKEFPNVNGVMHCFSGSAEFAIECTKVGYYVSLGGPVTFKNAVKPKEVVRKVPLEWLLLETDTPFLAPHPYRGKQNSPAKLPLIAEEFAFLRGISVDEVAKITTQNAEKVFKI